VQFRTFSTRIYFDENTKYYICIPFDVFRWYTYFEVSVILNLRGISSVKYPSWNYGFEMDVAGVSRKFHVKYFTLITRSCFISIQTTSGFSAADGHARRSRKCAAGDRSATQTSAHFFAAFNMIIYYDMYKIIIKIFVMLVSFKISRKFPRGYYTELQDTCM